MHKLTQILHKGNQQISSASSIIIIIIISRPTQGVCYSVMRARLPAPRPAPRTPRTPRTSPQRTRQGVRRRRRRRRTGARAAAAAAVEEANNKCCAPVAQHKLGQWVLPALVLHSSPSGPPWSVVGRWPAFSLVTVATFLRFCLLFSISLCSLLLLVLFLLCLFPSSSLKTLVDSCHVQ